MSPIGEARPWCSKDPECVLEDGHAGDACEVEPGARALSLEREEDARKRGVSKTGRDRSGRAMVAKPKAKP